MYFHSIYVKMALWVQVWCSISKEVTYVGLLLKQNTWVPCTIIKNFVTKAL